MTGNKQAPQRRRTREARACFARPRVRASRARLACAPRVRASRARLAREGARRAQAGLGGGETWSGNGNGQVTRHREPTHPSEVDSEELEDQLRGRERRRAAKAAGNTAGLNKKAEKPGKGGWEALFND